MEKLTTRRGKLAEEIALTILKSSQKTPAIDELATYCYGLADELIAGDKENEQTSGLNYKSTF